MESNHVKSINTDKRSNKRIKFASAKERSKRASADVYRSHKRKIGATSATTREQAVHNPHREVNARKRQRSHHLPVGEDKSKGAIIKIPSSAGDEELTVEDESLTLAEELEVSSSLANELDETIDRNASEVFGKFYRKMWPLVRSLPEILHHADKIIDLMLSHIVSPESSPERPSDLEAAKDPSTAPRGYIVNHATLDILHLMAVLARDLRHEIHPYLHPILQRIVQDLLNPAPPPPDSGKQPIPLDVTLVESAFRCMSYIFRYDADKILEDMESMRKYYGATLAARRELVRRLASETFAPLVRKLKNQNERHRHLKRVLKALVAATEGQPATPQLKRTQEDAVDGISQFIFQVVRGVPGRLHSQGDPTLEFVLTYCTKSASTGEETKEDSVLLLVASQFLHLVCYHIDATTTASLIGMLAGILKLSLTPESRKKSGFEPALNALKLFAKVAATKQGAPMKSENSEQVSLFYESLDCLFKEDCFPTLTLEVREEILSLLCPIWLSLQEEERLEKCLRSWLPVVFKTSSKGKKMSEEQSISVRNMTSILSRDLIPHLEHQQTLEDVGSITLSAAARVAQFDNASALLTVFALATKHHDHESESLSSGSLFVDGTSAGYKVSGEIQQKLMKLCLQDFNRKIWDENVVERLAVALRCVAFVAVLPHDGEQEKQKNESFKNAAVWYTEVLSTADKPSCNKAKTISLPDLVLIKALCLEGFSHLATDYLTTSGNVSTVQKAIRRLIEPAETLLFTSPTSLWAVRGVAAFVALLGRVEMVFNDKADETFDALVPNLSSPSHALRLHTLEILATYPMKIFVTDHADLDLEGDLDEEPSYQPQHEDRGTRQGPVGKCDMISTLLEIERMKVQLTKERPLLGLVSRVEVLGRSGRLPVVYAEAAARHMLGLFYVKFSPLWPVAGRALIALAKAQENAAWPALEAKLVSVMKPPSGSEVDLNRVEEDAKVMGYHDHLVACIQWEKSQGRMIDVFGGLSEVQDAEVHRHLTTDEATVMESVWGVAEKCQQLVAKHSRVIVPAFLEFLTDQYFYYHTDDPSARELLLKTGCSVDRSLLYTHGLQKRLLCFLGVFASIDGPQQLVQHKLLEQIFRSFLTHQETQVVQLSLACLLKFKPKHLVPYRDLLTGILEKGKLRNALLNFQEAIEAGKIVDDHRRLLIPVITRILFGRLSVRESRSGKDSPAARRAAILSFVSMVCREDDEVFSFVYLMTRSFVPRDKKLQEVESYTASDRFEILASLHDVDAAKLNLPSGVIEGFLHLLQAVVAQLGHRIKSYIPDLTSIVLALCEVAAVAKVADVNDAGPVTTQNSESQGSNNGLRRGAIRTLCYQRLSEIFSMYSGAVDFEKFGNQLWDAIGDSVLLLPEMVVKSERVPALLHMLETLSTNASLMQLLCMHKSAVSSIIKCIASTSFTAVMTSVLTIIENLLDGAIENPESRSREIVASYVPLLMEQFASRFTSSSDPEMPAKPLPFKRAKAKLRQATWRRELRILCRISDLLEQGDQSGLGGNSTVLEDLSELLLPFLEPDSGTSDEDKLNVLGILRSTLTRVGPDTLEMVYGTLSDVLGPSKGKPGIESISVRNEVARLVVVVGEQNRDLSDIAQKVAKMSAVNSKRIDEVDFETVIPELNSLCKDNDGCEWELLAGESPMNLAPIVSICFHYLYNEDGVLSRASFNSLKTLVFVASKTSKASQIWIKLLESLVVPPTRSGLQARTVSIRRFYILIIRETAKSFNGHDSPNLCGDLSALVDEDNPDLDFFIGVTHVQIHRRGRAFQRLRKVLRESSEESAGFTSQSLSGVLLPLALHPAYESKMKAEEPFALEGIATVGAIARHLPWNKYHNTVWSILSSFDRHPEQERYLIGTLCAIIDNFSFDLTDQSDGSEDNGQYEKTAVWRALERRVIPKLEGLLIKEKSDKSGKKNKIIRPAVVLALMKLFQKFPEKFFESKLPHILAVMCDALRNRDSDARDLARTTMAKIVTGMDLKYLADVVRELTITLNEGYKVHVRVATIHTILQELLAIHKAPESGDVSGLPVSTFDSSLPALMDILQEDLFGEANERRESQDTNVRYVKEAGGSKSVHSIEIMCRMLIFKPSDASSGNISKSSVHCVVSPLLERLRLSDINASTIRKIKEIVARVVIGLSHNPSVTPAELFPFVYATIQPFIGSQKISAVLDDEEDETYDSLQVSGSGNATKKKVEAKSGKVVEWRPSTLKHARSSKAAKDSQQKERQELRRVTDGASAPKLTGSGRHGTLDASDTHNLNDPATISAVVFGLNLLLSCLRKLHLNNDEDKLTEMMDPFVPMLTACICNCKDNDVALVAMKCLMSFLRFKLPSLATCSKSLGTQALTFLSSSGSSLNQNNDMTQACFRTLTYLINRDRTSDDQTSPQPTVGGAKGEEALAANTTMPLNGEQMKVLLSFLIVSITESDQHNPALSLIKAILSRKFTSPEFYDLMESMLKLCVRSQKASLRQQSAGIFIRYLLDYPMGEDRFEQHLKQIVANISYEYQDGRLSAIQMLTAVVEKLPDELLERHAQLLFLPQVLQLVNDDSKECREAVSKSLSTLLRRSSIEVLKSFHNYTIRWCSGEGPMQVASLQVFGIFVDTCRDFVQSNDNTTQWIDRLRTLVQTPSSSDWESTYFSLLCLEKMTTLQEADQPLLLTGGDSEVWSCIVERLVDSHPWIKLASCRIVQKLLNSTASDSEIPKVLEETPGMLFEIIRNLCFHLNVEEEEQSEESSENAIKTLTSTLPLVKKRPDLCFTSDSPHAGLRDPISWILRRLSSIAKPKGRQRRMAVYKCFAAFCSRYPEVVLTTQDDPKQRQLYMELMLEPLHRSDLEASNELDNPTVLHKASLNGGPETAVMTESSLAKDVLQMIEEGCEDSPEAFLLAYAAVKSRARDKKADRKVQAKAEAVQDPMGAALKKTKKQQQERQRKKRRVDDRRRDRGAQKKRRNHVG